LSGLIDIHTHWCLFGREPIEVIVELEWLEAGGFEKVVVFPLPGLGAPPEKVLDMVPGAYRELTGLNPARTANDDLESWLDFERRWRERPRTMEVLSFLDVRGWNGKADLSVWWGKGHAGLKSIIIEEGDSANPAPGSRPHPGRLPGRSKGSVRCLFALQSPTGVPRGPHLALRFCGRMPASSSHATGKRPPLGIQSKTYGRTA